MKYLIATTFAAAMLAAPAVATELGDLSSTFSDLKSCGGHNEAEAFDHTCKGPAGRTATLAYADGRIWVFFDGVKDGAAGKVEITASATASKVFGPKLEWRMRAGKPCAAVARIAEMSGVTLLVSDLSQKGGSHVLYAKTNDEARAKADEICGAPKRIAKGFETLTYEVADARKDPRGKTYWSEDILTQADGSARDYSFAIAERTIDGHAYVFTIALAGYFCGGVDCQYRVFKDGKQLPVDMACSELETHKIALKPLRLMNCGDVYKIEG